MSTQDDIKNLRARASQAEQKRAVAEAQKKQAEQKIDEIWVTLGKNYEVITPEELEEAISQKKALLAEKLTEAKKLLEDVES